jgi:hypothetical protein
MFPSSDNSLRTMMRRGIDAAIDFATLGEYGWATALDSLGDPTAFVPRPTAEPLIALAPPVVGTAGVPRRLTMASEAAASLAPTSAAARARANAGRRATSICTAVPARRLPVVKASSRTRGGAAPIHEQLCLLGC